MSHLTAPDITVLLSVPSSTTTSSPSTPTLLPERRISPSWPIPTLKSKLETTTGIPPSSQLLRLLTPSGWVSLYDVDSAGEELHVSDYPFRNGCELQIGDSRPIGQRGEYSDVSQVEKFELPKEEYEKLDDSVLAWKRRRGLGRFDPSAKSKQELEQERREKDQQVVAERGVEVGKRCRVGGDDGRRGVVRWVGEVEGLGGEKERGCTWVGVEFDEPGGRNDGSVIVTVTDYAERGTGEKDKDGKEEDDDENGKAIAKPTSKANHQGKTKNIRLFQCTPNYGVLARPEKIEMGDWPVLDDLGVDSDMEEI